MPNVRTARSFETTLSPVSSIVSRSRVSGMFPGRRSVNVAGIFSSPVGRCIIGRRRIPSSARIRRQSSSQSTMSGPPSSNVSPAASGLSTEAAK